ncbi:MAG: hypothetical protein WA774_17085, partial [Candidatus Acidiferrales bacterium]
VRIICAMISPATIPHNMRPESFGTFYPLKFTRTSYVECSVGCPVACRIPYPARFDRPMVYVRVFF